MPERRVTVAAPEGLHARPAAVFVSAVAESGIPVTIARPDGGEPVDARSILAVLTMDVRHGEDVLLRAESTGTEATLDRLAALLAGTNDPTGDGAADAAGTGQVGDSGTGQSGRTDTDEDTGSGGAGRTGSGGAGGGGGDG